MAISGWGCAVAAPQPPALCWPCRALACIRFAHSALLPPHPHPAQLEDQDQLLGAKQKGAQQEEEPGQQDDAGGEDKQEQGACS